MTSLFFTNDKVYGPASTPPRVLADGRHAEVLLDRVFDKAAGTPPPFDCHPLGAGDFQRFQWSAA